MTQCPQYYHQSSAENFDESSDIFDGNGWLSDIIRKTDDHPDTDDEAKFRSFVGPMGGVVGPAGCSGGFVNYQS
jgi:hypothetical protein